MLPNRGVSVHSGPWHRRAALLRADLSNSYGSHNSKALRLDTTPSVAQQHIMPPYNRAQASSLRKFMDKVMRDPSASFNERTDGPRFIKAALEFKDEPSDLLYRLTNPQELGAKRLKAALSCSDDAVFIRDSLLPFLKLLGCDALSRGTCKQPLIELVQTIYEVPGLLGCLCTALEADPANEPSSGAASYLGDVAPLGWLALNTALHVPGARQNPHISRIADALAHRSGAAAAAAARIRVLLAPVQAAAVAGDGTADMDIDSTAAPGVVAEEDLWQAAGGRHSNDHQDFREIQVMLTSDEALCQQPPFLPRASDSHLQLATCPEAALLDRQFRLLREDFVGPLRDELKRLGFTDNTNNPTSAQAGSAQQDSSSSTGSWRQHQPGSGSSWLTGVAASSRNVFQSPSILGVCMKPRPCIMVSFALPPSHRANRMKTKKEREEYWKQYGHGTLPLDALVCLASPGWPLVFATVVRRDAEELAAEHPMVGLAFEPGQQTARVLERMGQGLLPNTVLVQVSTNFLSTRPVLQCLQDMVDVPLADEIVHGKHPKANDYLDKDALQQDLDQLAPSFDPSQVESLQHALTSRLSLVQGPPGTGKTYTGVALCDLILKHSTASILCVCYTNHALDQFLEALLDKGINQIVRIGSRSKSQRLEQYNLRELERQNRGQTLSLAENRRFTVLHRELDQVQERIMKLSDLLTGSQGGSRRQGAGSSTDPANTNGSSGKGPFVTPAEAAAAANAAWQARSQQLRQQEEKAKQQRFDRAKQQGRSWAQADQPEPSSKSSNYWEWRDTIRPYLATYQSEVLKQLSVPPGMNKIAPDYLWKQWLRGSFDKGAVDRWQQSRQQPPPPPRRDGAASSSAAGGSDGRAEGEWTAAKTSRGGRGAAQQASQQPLPEPLATAVAGLAKGVMPDWESLDLLELLPQHLWALPWALRQQLASYWRSQVRQQWAEELQDLLQNQASKLQQELRSLQSSSSEVILKKARVIGCTTTGAALHKQLLTSRAVAPKVVMVEEAGEILEAHVLTSMGPNTEHLIMIGDHKQLRPKVESYQLSVQGGRGHTLNMSLFERLVLAGMPHTTLGVQHRMHPDISRLIKHTYPALQDHPSVEHRPTVKGLASRVVFVDHNQPELQEAAKGHQWSAAFEHQSKVNMHEVELTCATVRYMLQQGYQPDQLVVLTPYLGQLLEINRQLSLVMDVVLADMDVRDLRKAALPQALTDLNSSSGGAAAAKSGVRVATIDNYQGEESDIVIASLVRSNSKGSVGFLREPERINVLMSRARQGLILIGSSQTLLNASSKAAREHWGVVLQQLQAAGHIYSGLPAVCQQHNFRLPMLDSAAAFVQHAPDGGCKEPCMATLPCGHTCKLRCHSYDRDHMRVKCEESVYDLCSQGHLTTRLCSSTKAVCSTCDEIRQMEEKRRKEQQQLEFEAAKARADADKAKAKLSAEVDRLRSRLNNLADQAAAKQEAIKLELQKKKMEKELELQKQRVAADLSAWEDEERRRAAEELRQMDLEAELQAEVDRQQARLAAEQAKLQQKLDQSTSNLDQLQRQYEEKLQGIQNKKQRMESDAGSKQAKAEAAARLKRSQLTSVVKWRAALLQLSGAGASGLSTVKEHLLDPSTCADTLDVVFESPGLGNRLINHASAHAHEAPVPQPPKSAERGLSLLAKGELVDAMQVFDSQLKSATASSKASNADIELLQGLTEMCQMKLGLSGSSPPPAKKPRASSSKQPARQEPAATTTSHPVQLLVTAMRQGTRSISSGATSASKLRAGTGASDYRAQRAADAAAVGHALAFLVHPAVYDAAVPEAAGDSTTSSQAAAVHKCLIDEALSLLASKGPSAFGTTSTSPLLSESSSKSQGSDMKALQDRAGSSKVLLEMLEMTGMEPVKQQMLNLADQVPLDKKRGRDINSINYNVRFYGNPGTGKTTVARLYARLLAELGVLPEDTIEETNGAELVSGGTTKLQEQLKKLDKGGVLFIDEAYQLDPKQNPIGQQVLNYLLPEMENKRGKLVVVLAGYRKPMEENIMQFNEGLPSRFPLVFTFPDYTDDQLLSIFMGMLDGTKPVFKLADEKHARIAARRLGRQRDSGAPGFGNAREVRNLLELAISRQSARVLEEQRKGLDPDLLELQRDDLLGPKELDVSSSQPLQQLKRLTGLSSVKQSVDNLLGLIRTNAELEEQEKPLKDVCLNRVFLGNPGTGKTTVAGIYGAVLRDLGLLSKGDVLVKVPADFIGDVLGASEKKTMAILEEARGRVLVIDEAYGLHAGKGMKDPFKEAVIDTIVAKVQGVPGDDRCVLLLGYKDQMGTMMREANPGLARRFQLSQAWYFEDYSDTELLTIIQQKADKSYGWELDWPCLQAALATLGKERRRPNFGNAGAVNNLLSAAAMRMEDRNSHLSPADRSAALPAPEDFLTEADAAAAAAGGAASAAGVFADLIGCKSVLEKLKEWQATITASQKLGVDPLESFELNFLFVGSPGTGKTTIARRVGKLFQQLGILATDEVVECSAGDFVTGYVNQSSGKTRDMFQQALGGVLLIDEAYRLNPKYGGSFMSEVLDEICQILTDKQFKGKMVVVLAGYEAQVEELLSVNPGLKSRFSERLLFPDFTADDAMQLLRQQLQSKYGVELSEEAAGQLAGYMQQLMNAPGWSNGRDVITWVKRIFRAYSRRIEEEGDDADEGLLSVSDLQISLQDFLASKAPAKTSVSADLPNRGSSPWDRTQLAPQFAEARPSPPTAMQTDTARAPPVVDVVVTSAADQIDTEQDMQQDTAPAGPGSFGNLPIDFLQDVQTLLEDLGYDLTSADAMQRLAGDSSLAQQLLPALTQPGTAPATVLERLRQWQQAIQEQLEMERKMKAKQQRPVWRCAACGRYGCPVAPYIESYQEFE